MTRGFGLKGLIIAGSALILGSACGNGSPSTATHKSGASSQDVGDVLAMVNDMPIGTEEFDRTYARSLPRRTSDATQDEEAKKREVLDRLIADKLLYQEALRQGLDKDPKIQRMMINQLLRKDVYGTLRNSDISDEELRAYFEEHREEFVVPEKVQVRRILIKKGGDLSDEEARKKAEKIHAAVVADPASFKEWAMKESQDPYARRGGDVGFISRAGKPGLDSKVVEEAFKLEVDQISPVFETDEGYNIIQVVNKRDRVERSFEQMKGAVLRRVKTEKSRKLQKEYIENLKKNAKIVVNEDKLKEHKPEVKASQGGFPGIRPMMQPSGFKRTLPPKMEGTKAENKEAQESHSGSSK